MEAEQEYPTTMEPATKMMTAEELLQHVKALIAEKLLSQDQVDQLVANPLIFLIELLPTLNLSNDADDIRARRSIAQEVMKAVVVGYFRSLIEKAQAGEKFHAQRLQEALIRAQTIAIEALAEVLQNGAADTAQKIRIAELFKDA